MTNTSPEPQDPEASKAETGENGSQKSTKAKPKKVLPTTRLNLSKHLEILRGYAIASGPERKAVKLEGLGNVMQMHPNTVTMVNPFFSDVGLIVKDKSGGYVPVQEVFDYNAAYEWDATMAGRKLAPILGAAWFAKEIVPRLSLRPLEESTAMADLGAVADAGPDYKPNIKLLLDYLETAALLQRDGTKIIKVPSATEIKAAGVPPQTAQSSTVSMYDQAKEQLRESTKKATNESTAPTEGAIHFSVSIDVDMREIATWTPERIAAFFAGMAKALAASKGTQESSE